jgi:aspartate/methionine/tyrosine aminotransferase
VTFDRAPEDGFALDPERVARSMTDRTRVVVVTNLHNPSGVRSSDEVLRAVARLAEARGATLLVDEVYAPFDGLVDETGVFHASARKLGPNVVAVSSLTKCYGLGPQRIGWLLGPREVVARAHDAVTASAGMLPLPHAHLALHAFARLGKLAERGTGGLANKRARVTEWVRSMGFAWSGPAEGLFGFGIVPGAGDITALLETTALEREVLVAPGGFFGVANGFRISWSRPLEVVEEGLSRLGEALRGVAR